MKFICDVNVLLQCFISCRSYNMQIFMVKLGILLADILGFEAILHRICIVE